MNIFFSNRVESLYERLKEDLFSSPFSPFSRRLVIVPSPAMKSWLMIRLARDPECGIAAGMEVSYLDDSLATIASLSRHVVAPLPSKLELSLAIEVEIHRVMLEAEATDGEELALWGPLLHYLKGTSRRKERRVAALAEKLADLFVQYGRYGSTMLQDWERREQSGWQQQLWRRLCRTLGLTAATFSPLPPPSALYSPAPLQVYLFAMSFLSSQQHRFLQKTSELVPVNYYLLSPCMAFWSDIKTDKESWQLREVWKKQGASDEQQQALDEFLRDRNPLLANFGKLGREMAAMVEQSDAAASEGYILPGAVQNLTYYDNSAGLSAEFDDTRSTLTLLDAVQADMALLRNPDKTSPITLDPSDRTIQLHMAATPLREVQALYDTIMRLIASHADDPAPLCPGEIVVMAPDIMEYDPYIRSVFGANDSALDYQIMDIRTPERSTFIQAFLHLLALPLGRWDAASLHELWEHPAFQYKHGLVGEDVHKIWQWIKDAGVIWGHDVAHRDDMLKRDHCTRGMPPEATGGTWEFGISRILAGLVTTVEGDPEEGASLRVLPLESAGSGKPELVGKWLALLKALRSDINPLSDGTKMTVDEWGGYLKCLCEAWLSPVPCSGEESEIATLYSLFDSFKRAAKSVGNETYPFTTIRKHLETALNEQTSSYREHRLQAIRFCSMLPMRAIPAQVVALLGMHEGAFPRLEPSLSLDLLKGNPLADYRPSRPDFDRYLFLEALISARRCLVISYLGYSAKDAKEQGPSLVVSELMGYLDKAYRLGDRLPSQTITVTHPYNAFDKRCFEKDSPCRSYSQGQFKAAQAYYHHEKQPPHSFIKEFAADQTEKPPTAEEFGSEVLLTIRQLNAFARDPIKNHFNKTLGMYIEEEGSHRLKSEEDFLLSSKDTGTFKAEALKQPLSHLLNLEEKRGTLPHGIFKQLAITNLKEEVEEIHEKLGQLQVTPNQSITIDLSETCSHPLKDYAGNWVIPPLEIPLSEDVTVKITGQLHGVTPQGLITYGSCNNRDLIKRFPEYLVFDAILKKYPIPAKREILFAKDGKAHRFTGEDSEKTLQQYLLYYFSSQRHISPLVPEWCEKIVGGDLEELKKQVGNQTYNDCINWMTPDAPLPRTEILWENWNPLAVHLFSEHLIGKQSENDQG